jgi:formylglycine-generating enzyme required for sulfatase activity
MILTHRSLLVLPFVVLPLACRDRKPDTAPTPVHEMVAPIADAGEPDTGAGSQPTRTGPAPVPMIHFDAAKFLMGMDAAAIGGNFSDSQPIHPASVPGFWLDVYEVNVAAYRACVEAGACTADGLEPNPQKGDLEGCNWNQPGYENDPINCVTWDQAAAYCRWAGKELPTEEMWEYAAAGPKRRQFPWGMGVRGAYWGLPEDYYDRVGSPCQSDDAHPPRPYRRSHTCPVGNKPKGDTPEGIKDMAANVREWTASPLCPYKNPKCSTRERVIRGGAYTASPFDYWCVARGGDVPEARYDYLGFRCARPDSR